MPVGYHSPGRVFPRTRLRERFPFKRHKLPIAVQVVAATPPPDLGSATLCIALALGSTQTGLALTAQLATSSGTPVGGRIYTGFAEMGNGHYLWTYPDFSSGWQGMVQFRAGGVLKAVASVSPGDFDAPTESAYTYAAVIGLGSAATGLTLTAQIVDSNGSNVGAAISSGFVEVGRGFYSFSYASFSNTFHGGIKFLNGSTVRAFLSINPSDGLRGADAEETPDVSSILDWALLEDPVKDEAEVVGNPLAERWYSLDVAWGPDAGSDPQVVTTTLSCAGATLDATFEDVYRGHVAGAANRIGVDLGWSPNGTSVYLSDDEQALGYWRIWFPSPGLYTVSLSNIGSFSITVVGTAPAVTSPTITVIHHNPLNRQPSKLLELTFSGTYPSGGLDVNADMCGLASLFWADCTDTAAYRFRWDADKLRVYDSNGEVSGAISFTTRGLFIGNAG